MTNIVIHLPTEAEIHHVKRPMTVQTPSGPSKAFKGDFVLTVGNDQWPVSPHVLKSRYEAKDEKVATWLDKCLKWNEEHGVDNDAKP
jgi:hypothetical protein